jgi:two-component system, sensor histidine kinase
MGSSFRHLHLIGIHAAWFRVPIPRVGPYGSVLLGVSTVLLIWLGAFYFISQERLHAERAAQQNGANLDRAFEEQIIRSLRAVDQTLLYARDMYVRDRKGFDISLWSRNRFLMDLTFQVSIIGADGHLVASNISGVGGNLDLSDRQHFKVHVTSKDDQLFISKPVFGRVSGKWSIQLTRRINNPDGSFGGVVVVSLDPDYLSRFYESIDLGTNGVIALIGTDGIVRARAASGAPEIGASVVKGPLLSNFARTRAGSFYTTSQLDGIDRLFNYREVRGYPLVVVVGLARSEIFAQYESDRMTYLVIASLLSLWMIAATSAVARYQSGLARARDAAEAGTRARSGFLAMMSHEIRTPMNGVIGTADLLIESGLNPEQLSLVSTLRDSAEHLTQIIDDVLDFSKLEADRIELEQIEFDIRRMVRGSIDILAPRAQAKGIALQASVSPNVPVRVLGDPARLRQVLLNLIGNAVKFTKTGGVSVTVARESESGADDMTLGFAVADTGIGIPDDAVGLLFREFSQVDGSIARRFGGTGLGLVICQRLTNLMGGEISVKSKVGFGSVFRFTVRVRAASSEEDAPHDDITIPTQFLPEIDGRRARILLAEDNLTNRMVAIKLLQKLGVDVDIAVNGVDAVAACTSTVYDLVFMDMMMPEMDGLAATRAIRQLPPPYCSPHIVALTANVQPSDRTMCLQSGMNDFLAKPITRKGLAGKLQRFLPSASAAPSGARSSDEPEESHPAPAFAPDIYDPASYAALEEAIGEESAQLVVSTFVEDTKSRINVMREQAQAGSNQNVAIDAHATKSSAAMLGFQKLSLLAKTLEADAATLDRQELESRIEELADAYVEVCERVLTRAGTLRMVHAK